jgi:SET domain-containing protein
MCFLNHSCVPNVAELQVDDTIVFLTHREIFPNEEIFISYIDGKSFIVFL